MKSLGISKVIYVCRHYGGTVLEDEVVEIVGEWTSALGDHIMEDYVDGYLKALKDIKEAVK